MRKRTLGVAALGALASAVAFGIAYRTGPAPPPTEVDAVQALPQPAAPPTAATRSQPDATGPILLRDMLQPTGITFRHTDGSSGERYIVEAMTGGVAVFDYNADGLPDIYFLNGRRLPGCPDTGPPPRNALYRNEGDWKFTDATAAAGLDGGGFGMGVAVADWDNDGFPDVYVNNFGLNVLYRNNGDGTFTDMAPAAGVTGAGQIGAGTNFLDLDGDGDLDLFVSNYVEFSYEQNAKVTVMGFAAYAGPYLFNKQPNDLYRNNGDGTFADIGEASGIRSSPGAGMGTVCADYDGDGDTDIIVNNDMSANFLFENDGRGSFEEVALRCGTALDANGQAQSSMGVDCADYDNDGLLDLFSTSFASEMPVLYQNLGERMFADVTVSAGDLHAAYPHVNWGTGFIDFDNDGWRDLYLANGHLDENVREYDQAAEYDAADYVFRNTGSGRFENVSAEGGDGLALRQSGRGAAFGDLDRDGRLDVVVLTSRREPAVLRNESPGGKHWLQIALVGVAANREGIGARVRVTAGGLEQIDELHSGRGYQSHWGTHLHFGLGDCDRADAIEVHWLGGGSDRIENVAADQYVTIIQGRGLVGAGQGAASNSGG